MEHQFKESDVKASLIENIRLQPDMYLECSSAKGLCAMIESLTLDLLSSAKMEDVTIELNAENTVRIISSDISVEPIIRKFNILNSSDALTAHKNIQDLAILIALSEAVKIEVYDAGKIYTLAGEKGKFSLNVDEGYLREDLIIDFTPDKSIFETTDVNFEYLCSVFRRISHLNAAVKITCVDNSHEDFQQSVFHYPDGIFSKMDNLVLERSIDEPSLRLDIDESRGEFKYKISFCFLDYSISPYVQSFAGYRETLYHGSLVNGVVLGIIRSITDFGNKNNLNIEVSDSSIGSNGFMLITSVIGSEFKYAGPLKIELDQPEIEIAVEEIVYNRLSNYFEINKEKAIQFVEKFSN